MRKVSEYELNAQECLKLATMIGDPEHKTASYCIWRTPGPCWRMDGRNKQQAQKRNDVVLADWFQMQQTKAKVC